MEKRTRRKFSREFKIEAVKLVTEQHYTTSEAARNLGSAPICSGGGGVSWKQKLPEPAWIRMSATSSCD